MTGPAASPVALITGGAGFVGQRLGTLLVDKGWQAVLYDVRPAPDPMPVGIRIVVGDLRDEANVRAACQGCDIVFHVASYGMSGHEAMDRQRVYEVNVTGTQNILHACQAEGVGRLVYVSSYNAVFDGSRPIHGGDEASSQIIDYRRCSCPYTATKAEAEQLVLAADCTRLLSVGSRSIQLRTCVIRPAGIYGPGEQRHTMRILRLKRLGLLQFTFGDPCSLADFIHCDNLCRGLIQAAEGLSQQRGAIAGGQVYFMSDGKPVNNFRHWQGIIEGAGYSWPTLRLPFLLVYYVGATMELVCLLARLVGIPLTPMLSRTEVVKCAVTHYFKIDKARHQLGFDPQPYDLARVGAWYKEHGHGPAASSTMLPRLCPGKRLWVLVVLVIMAAALAMHSRPV